LFSASFCIMFLAAAWSDQKSGLTDLISSSRLSFSFAATSKMHHVVGDPGL